MRLVRVRGVVHVPRSALCVPERVIRVRGPLFVDPLRVSTITGGGSEARMLPRPRITPVRVNLPPNQDVVRVVSSYITCRAHRRQGVFLFFFSSPLPIPAKKIVFRAEKKSVRNEAKKREEERRTRNVPSDLAIV